MPSPTYDQYLQRRYFEGLNGIRCLAIVAVVWHHTTPPGLPAVAHRGFLGVDLFFVLSGYLIVTLLLRERSRTGRVSLKEFWVRRILRLLPAYYLTLLLLTVAYLIFKPSTATIEFLKSLPIYALYLSNWIQPHVPNLGPTWSLATEEQFYVVWPFIESVFTPIIKLSIWIAALIVNQLVNFGFLAPHLRGLEIMQVTFTPILLGVGLAYVLHAPIGYRTVQAYLGRGTVAALILLILVVLVVASPPDISGTPRFALHMTFALWIATIVLQPGGRMVALLELGPAKFVGMVSYGVYIYHMFCIHFVRIALNKAGLSEVWLFPAGLAASVAVAALSYFAFEKRFLDLRHRFRS